MQDLPSTYPALEPRATDETDYMDPTRRHDELHPTRSGIDLPFPADHDQIMNWEIDGLAERCATLRT